MLIRSILTIVASLMLAGCSATVTDTACTAFQPIWYTPTQDSEGTVTQVRQHNASWVSLCERKRSG